MLPTLQFYDRISVLKALKLCQKENDISKTRLIHEYVAERNIIPKDVYISTTLITTYARCGVLKEAREVFEKMPVRSVVSWNALISGYAQNGLGNEALECFREMAEVGVTPDSITYISILKACGIVGSLEIGEDIDATVRNQGLLQKDVVLGNALVSMYSKIGVMEKAREVFDQLPLRNVVSWNALLTGYARKGLGEEVLKCFRQMTDTGIPPTEITYVSILKACGLVGSVVIGKEIDAEIRKKGLLQKSIMLGSALVDMYSKVPLMLFEAWEVFVHMPTRLIITWTSLIGAYAEHGLYEEVLDCFVKMQVVDNLSPDAIAYLDSLKACGFLGATNKGQGIHSCIVKQGIDRDEFVIGALVDMYANCGLLNEAWVVFDHKLSFPNVVPWTTLISGFAFQGDIDNVIHLLEIMRYEGIEPDEITLLSILTVCSHVGLVDFGCEYFQVLTKDYSIDLTIEHHNCLLDLFGRAGQLDELVTMVKDMPIQPNFISYRTVLGACKKWENIGLGRQAFDCAVRLGKQQTAPFVLISNIYAVVDSEDSSILDNHGYMDMG